MSSVETHGLTRRFGSLVAVDELTFDVKEGEVFGFLGPNGAGKTTTIRMLACLISPSEGSATVGGYDVHKEPLKVRGLIGVLTENPSLYERLTALENLDFFAQAYGLANPQEKQRRIEDLLRFFTLWERRNDRVATFSKGMKQKLAVARALVHNPSIIFLDEPTSGLDPESSKEIRDLITQLSHQNKSTILLCTHRLEDAEKLCDRVMIVDRGRNVISGTPNELEEKISGPPALHVTLTDLDTNIIDSVRRIHMVSAVEVDGTQPGLKISTDDLIGCTPEVIRAIVLAGGNVLSASVVRPSLEDAYLKLIHKDASLIH
jgi:ABC-2 type transport system ATP-binding protein